MIRRGQPWGDVREGHYRLGDSQCKGPVVGSKVRLFAEWREGQFC